MSSMHTASLWYNVIEGSRKYVCWNATTELCDDSFGVHLYVEGAYSSAYSSPVPVKVKDWS